MTTLLLTHPACVAHDPGRMHPEHPGRLKAVLKALEADEFAALVREEAPLAERKHILAAHPESHIDLVEEVEPERGYAAIDSDTVLSKGSVEAAYRGAGAAVAAVDAVMAGRAKNAFCATRPPGHHAEPTRAMGFCLFDNVAVAAYHALNAHGLDRVAIMDFDVHHGNGTQAIFWDEGRVMYASTHQSPLYPGTGMPHERGTKGTIVNATLPPGAGGDAFRAAMTGTVLPAMESFDPELVIVSAGFDADARDPLANLELGPEDFAWATERLLDLAEKTAGGRLVSVLEGGYDLEALAEGAAAHVGALMARA
ncbi:MAG: histone deacetylase family protein [Alphaproteobacteria bacterium]|nr:histone deacetylase family protein [Alphaproteobacteria bacterium]